MKVKMFFGNDTSRLKQEINDFIKDKYVIEIRYQSVPIVMKYNNLGTPIKTEINDRVLIMYR